MMATTDTRGTHVLDEVEEEGHHARHVVEVADVLRLCPLDGIGVIVHTLTAGRHLYTADDTSSYSV